MWQWNEKVFDRFYKHDKRVKKEKRVENYGRYLKMTDLQTLNTKPIKNTEVSTLCNNHNKDYTRIVYILFIFNMVVAI